ncbi:MAG: GxxExxY protein [Acidobacteria bacterium]|nr:GxxExxY protein [Acidobacteriota bacterium]MBI3488907.1 GxxExxY protein [Acidobacteriota bacterium]
MIHGEITEKVLGAAIEVHKHLGPGLLVDAAFRLDLVAEGKIIVELKSQEGIHPIHEAQLMTYLKLTGMRVGLLLNFNVPMMKDGILRRVV